jgi:pimeloyl-ACP methyl ester carboxylesterase
MGTATRIEANFQEGYADVNGIRLHFAEAGSGDNLVILLHGFPEFWYSWRHQLPVLGERYHVVAPDMRGYNLSDKPSRVEDYRVDVLVEDVIGLIKNFDADRVAIVAHDWGAAVAWKVAEKHPHRVSRLAILQVPPAAAWRANITLAQVLRSWYMFLFQLPRFPEWLIRRKNFATIEKMFKESVARKNTFTDADIELYKEALARPGALTAALNYYRANVRPMMSGSRKKKRAEQAMASATQREAAKTSTRIRVPTLFIYGEQDVALVPATVRGIGRFIDAPYVELRIADSGHWVQNEAAAEVNSALLDFLAKDFENDNAIA